jgi:hypothetical protein
MTKENAPEICPLCYDRNIKSNTEIGNYSVECTNPDCEYFEEFEEETEPEKPDTYDWVTNK